jgi:hypothetical protein
MDIVLPQVEIENGIFEVEINSDNLAISKNEIEVSLGYADGKIPEHFGEIIDDILSKVSQYCEIKAGYGIFDVKKTADRLDGLYVGGEFFQMQKIVTGQIKKAESAALFVCTIGPALETWSKKLLQTGDGVKGYIIDSVASVTAESVTDLLHDHIGEKMKERGLKITNRYSPGYCNWSVSEQKLLFSLLPQKFCGVTLTDSALMLPVKSVSGVIGIGSDVKRTDYICDSCGIKDCTHRAVRVRNPGRSNMNMKKTF